MLLINLSLIIHQMLGMDFNTSNVTNQLLYVGIYGQICVISIHLMLLIN